ncbi:MAG: hypothetical protein M1840_008807 [Geoglossum simile]|nr:MAG: hypothetical protein M1840_008807 [Geoglossum simile]
MKRTRSQPDLPHADKRVHIKDHDSFPVYAKGTVEIQLSEDSAHHYRLHKAVLGRGSVWFMETLNQPFVEAGPTQNSGRVLYRYILHANGGNDEPLLTRVSLVDPPTVEPIKSEEEDTTMHMLPSRPPSEAPTGANPTDVASSTVNLTSGTTRRGRSESSVIIIDSVETSSRDIVRRDVVEVEAEVKARAKRAQQCRLEAYNNLFLVLYSQEPQISTTNIRIALGQCEALVRLAELYRCLNIVRVYICTTLHQYRDQLYRAIAKDPPRWLLISIPIQSGPIFAEAAIHCIGCWPQWPWKTTWGFIPSKALALIKAKAFELQRLRADTERNLFLNTIRLGTRSATLSENNDYHFDTWMVVSVFRNWLANAIQECLEVNQEHLPIYFHKMSKAGDAYLPLPAVELMLFKFNGAGFGRWTSLAEDLGLIKKFAEEEVRAITRSNLTLKVEDAKINYLTCSNIRMNEYPWVEGDSEWYHRTPPPSMSSYLFFILLIN